MSAQSASGNTYGRRSLDHWKEFLDQELAKEQQGEPGCTSLCARVRNLGYRQGISDKDLIEILVEIDEFYGQEIIEFVEYDERIYEYCKKGPTTRNSEGNSQAKAGGNLAKAGDWYNFANMNMLM
eukprot:1284-Ditylum_brightwellii.AAC.1